MASDNSFAGSSPGPEDAEFNVRAADMATEFGNIFVRKQGDRLLVQLTFLPDPNQRQNLKAWKTGVALDASASMKKLFGRRVIGHIPETIAAEYEDKGWLRRENIDGRKIKTLSRLAVDDALDRNLIILSPNTMDYVGAEFSSYLAKNLDRDNSTTIIYWSGGNGREVESLGDINESASASLNLDGPDRMTFGTSTRLLPAVKYCVEHIKNSELGLFVFLTDGRIEDLEEVRQYTAALAQDILNGQRTHLKLVLVGIGEDIDEQEWRQLSNLDGHNFANIWEQMMVSDFQDMLKIFTEVIRDSKIVALQGAVLDDQGQALKKYPAGLPSQLVFSMPSSASGFRIEMDDKLINQPIILPQFR